MERVLRFVVPVAVVLLVSSAALAETEGGGDRPRGFALDVGIAASTPVFAGDIGELFFYVGPSIVPKLSLGAQLGRLSIMLDTSIALVGQVYELAGEDGGNNVLTVGLGPSVDGEIWSAGRVALFLYGGIDVLIYRVLDVDGEGDPDGATGFAIDAGLGGRVYVFPQFQIALKVGTSLQMAFWEDVGDQELRSQAWSIYGALAFRFVASR